MKRDKGKILIVDDDLDILATAKIFLKQYYPVVQVESDPSNISKHLESESYDLILLDMNFQIGESNGTEGLAYLNQILDFNPTIAVLPMTAYGEIDLAVEAVKNGAVDFITKPWKNEKLLATINAALRLRDSSVENEKLRATQRKLRDDLDQGYAFIGQSPAMRKVMANIDKVSATEANVLLLGENGTGKEMAARAIHQKSNRNQEVFISVDLGALSENLFESELFGHVKGAFTDAKESKAGRFELASGGTIFLDEIGNLTLPLQAKLLSVLQQRKIQRLGSGKEIPINVRLICATNMPLHEMVQSGDFRQDLLYRINTIEINLPPLRERFEDIPLLVNHFMKRYGKKYKQEQMRLDAGTLRKLQKYHWPGNIRELQHAVERAIIMAEGNQLAIQDLIPLAQANREGDTPASLNLKDMEKKLIIKALEKNGGNITHAAKELGIDRLALYRRMEKYGL